MAGMVCTAAPAAWLKMRLFDRTGVVHPEWTSEERGGCCFQALHNLIPVRRHPIKPSTTYIPRSHRMPRCSSHPPPLPPPLALQQQHDRSLYTHT